MNERRISDKLIETILNEMAQLKVMVGEIHQRQIEKTIPSLNKLEHCIFGNDKVGLIEEVGVLKDRVSGIVSLKRWVIGSIVSVGLAIISFATAWGYLLKTVQTVEEMIRKHIGM